MSGAAVSLPLHVLLLLCLLVLFLVPSRGDSSCPNSESAPCGNASISYPFWLSNDANQTSPYCGYHGFMLTCQSDIPILSLGDHNYRVLQINYTGTVVSLADDDIFSPAQESCPRLRQNVTLPSNVALSYAHTYNNLTFFFNCSNSDSTWSSNMIPCFQFNRSGTDIMRSYVFLGIPNEFDSSTDCSEVVIWPAMESHVGNQLVEGYAAALREGFELHWTVDINGNCSHCKNSGVRRKKHALKIGVAIGTMIGVTLACFISSTLCLVSREVSITYIEDATLGSFTLISNLITSCLIKTSVLRFQILDWLRCAYKKIVLSQQ